MARVVFAERADSDAAGIINDLMEVVGESVASRYYAAFDNVYRRLEAFPESGSPRPHLGALARICTVAPYVIVYDYSKTDATVTVLRVLHGRREITRKSIQGR